MRKCSSYSCFRTRRLRPKRLHTTQARIGGRGQGQVGNPMSYHTVPWFSQILLRFSAVGKGIQFVIATPHPNYNNLNSMVWSCPLYIPGELLIKFLRVFLDICLMQDWLCFQGHVSPPQGQMDIGPGTSPGLPFKLLSTCISCDISGTGTSLGSDWQLSKTQGSELVSNCVWLMFTRLLLVLFLQSSSLRGWWRDSSPGHSSRGGAETSACWDYTPSPVVTSRK